MKKNRLLKQSLAVLLSLSMSLGPCAPGSFAAFADTAGVSSEVETDTGEAMTDTGEEADSQAEAEVSEEKSEEASGDSVSAGNSTDEETADEAEGEVPEDDGKDQGASDQGTSDQDALDQGASDSGSEETGTGKSDGEGEGNGVEFSETEGNLVDYNSSDEDGTGTEDGEEVSGASGVDETGSELKDASAASSEGEDSGSEETGSEEDSAGTEEDTSGVAVEESGASETEEAEKTDAVCETAASEAEIETVAKNDETETEDTIKNTEDQHVLQAEVDETIISAIYDDGVFPENVTLEVRKVDEDSAEHEEIREKVAKALKETKHAETKEEESAEETEDENRETVGEESTRVWFSAFEIRVLDENGEEYEPDTEKGDVFVRFEYLRLPDDENNNGWVKNNVRLFGTDDLQEGKIKELTSTYNKDLVLSEDEFVPDEGTVMNDIDKIPDEAEDREISEADNYLQDSAVTVDLGKNKYVIAVWILDDNSIYSEKANSSFEEEKIVNGYVVSLFAKAGVLPEGTIVSVEPVTTVDGINIEELLQDQNENEIILKVMSFNITFTKTSHSKNGPRTLKTQEYRQIR